jgi:hypothetical protein
MPAKEAEPNGNREQRRVACATASHHPVAREQEPGQQDVDVRMRMGKPVDEIGREGERDRAEEGRQ